MLSQAAPGLLIVLSKRAAFRIFRSICMRFSSSTAILFKESEGGESGAGICS